MVTYNLVEFFSSDPEGRGEKSDRKSKKGVKILNEKKIHSFEKRILFENNLVGIVFIPRKKQAEVKAFVLKNNNRKYK